MRNAAALAFALVAGMAGAAPITITPPAKASAPEAVTPLLAPPPNDATELPPIEITPGTNPFDGLAKLRRSLPCVGCEGDIIKAKQSIAERAMRYFLLPSEPKEPTPEEKERAALFCMDAGRGFDSYCGR